MHIKIIGTNPASTELFVLTSKILSNLWLSSFVTIEENNDEAYKIDLGITENPAFCIEEKSIDFRDVIFQGVVPDEKELSSLIISIIWWDEEDSCSTSWCGSCSWCC